MQTGGALLVGDCLSPGYLCKAGPKCISGPRINALQGCDVNRTNDLVKIAKQWQPATEMKYVSSAQLGQEALALRDEDARHREAIIHGHAITLEDWSDAASGGQPSMGKR